MDNLKRSEVSGHRLLGEAVKVRVTHSRPPLVKQCKVWGCNDSAVGGRDHCCRHLPLVTEDSRHA